MWNGSHHSTLDNRIDFRIDYLLVRLFDVSHISHSLEVSTIQPFLPLNYFFSKSFLYITFFISQLHTSPWIIGIIDLCPIAVKFFGSKWASLIYSTIHSSYYHCRYELNLQGVDLSIDCLRLSLDGRLWVAGELAALRMTAPSRSSSPVS